MSQPDTVTEPDHMESSPQWAARSFRVFITAAAVMLFNQSLSAREERILSVHVPLGGSG